MYVIVTTPTCFLDLLCGFPAQPDPETELTGKSVPELFNEFMSLVFMLYGQRAVFVNTGIVEALRHERVSYNPLIGNCTVVDLTFKVR